MHGHGNAIAAIERSNKKKWRKINRKIFKIREFTNNTSVKIATKFNSEGFLRGNNFKGFICEANEENREKLLIYQALTSTFHLRKISFAK